jgi:hypothetical protein
MTVDRLSDEERAQLQLYEDEIQSSEWIKIDRVIKINEGNLWRESYSTFEDYLWHGLAKINFGKGWKPSTYRQKKASYAAYNLARTIDVDLKDESAARALRNHELKPAGDMARIIALQTAIKYYEMDTGEEPTKLTAAMIKPAVQEVVAVMKEVAMTGYVDTGDGSMTAMGAAIEQRLQERILRKRQHIIESAKKWGGWSEPSEIALTRREFLMITGRDLPDPDAEGSLVQIRWRLVEELDPEGEAE